MNKAIRAHIDLVSPGLTISGWAIDPQKQNLAPRLGIYIGEALAGVCVANTYRSDLDVLGGDCKHAFSAKLISLPKLTGSQQVRLVDLDGTAEIEQNHFVIDGVGMEKHNAEAFKLLLERIRHSNLFDQEYFSQQAQKTFASDGESIFWYLSDKSNWALPTSSWMDVEFVNSIRNNESIAEQSPLEWYLGRTTACDVGPNPLFSNLDFSSAWAGEFTDFSSPFDAWLETGESGKIFAPSAFVDPAYFAKKSGVRFNQPKKLIGAMKDWIRTPPAQRSLENLHPYWEQKFIYQVLLLKKLPDRVCLLSHFRNGRFCGVPPCAILSTTPGNVRDYYADLKKYDRLVKNHSIDDLSQVSSRIDVEKFNAAVSRICKSIESDSLTNLYKYQTKLKQCVLPAFLFDLDANFVATEFPGFVEFIGDKTGYKDLNYAWCRWIDQLGLPRNYRDCAKQDPAQAVLPKLESIRNIGSVELTNPRATVLIPSYGRDDLVMQCLLSMFNVDEAASTEFIIAEDAAHIDCAWILEYFFPTLKIIRNEVNKGFLLNCNDAAAFATGEYLVLVNNDIIARPDALRKLLSTFDFHPSVGIVGGLILNSDGTVQENGALLWRDASAWNYNRNLRIEEISAFNIRDVDYVSGCWIGVKRELWTEIGGFDTRYAPAYCEESDLCLTAQSLGYRVCTNPASVVTHLDGATMGVDVNANNLKSYQVVNSRKLREKWDALLAFDFHENGSPSPFHTGRKHSKKFVSLVFDHYIPEPDRDAGSRTIFSICKALAAVPNNYVIFIPANNHRSRYAGQLESLGIEIITGRLGWERLDRLLNDQPEKIKYALVSRHQVAKQFSWHLGKIRAKKSLYIHDIDTLRALPYLPDTTREEGFVKEAIADHFGRYSNIYTMFDNVLSCSRAETALLQKNLGDKVVDIFPYDGLAGSASPYSENSRHDVLFVGSYNHTPNREGLKVFLQTQWPQVVKKLPDVKLHIVGSGFENDQSFSGENIVLHGYVSDHTLAYLYSICKLSISPLLSGAGIKGKVIEALGNGVPCCGTAVAYQGLQLPSEFGDLIGEMATMGARIVRVHKAYNRKMSHSLREQFDQMSSEDSINTVIRRLVEDASRRVEHFIAN